MKKKPEPIPTIQNTPDGPCAVVRDSLATWKLLDHYDATEARACDLYNMTQLAKLAKAFPEVAKKAEKEAAKIAKMIQAEGKTVLLDSREAGRVADEWRKGYKAARPYSMTHEEWEARQAEKLAPEPAQAITYNVCDPKAREKYEPEAVKAEAYPKELPIPEEAHDLVARIVQLAAYTVQVFEAPGVTGRMDSNEPWTVLPENIGATIETIRGAAEAAKEEARRAKEAEAISAGVAREVAAGNLNPASLPEFSKVPHLPTVAALRRFIKPGVRLELVKHSAGSKHLGTIREVKTVQTNAFTLVDASGKESWLNFPKAAEYGSTTEGFTVNDGNTRMEYRAHAAVTLDEIIDTIRPTEEAKQKAEAWAASLAQAVQSAEEGGDKEGEGGQVQPAPDPTAWIRETLEAVATSAPLSPVDQAKAAALSAGGTTEETSLCFWVYLPKEAAEAREIVKAAGFKWAQKRLGWYRKHEQPGTVDQVKTAGRRVEA